jgi:hypothetical protein
MELSPGAAFKVAVEIVPAAGLLGPDGLRLELAPSAARAWRISAPAEPLTLPGEPVTQAVEGTVGKLGPDQEIALKIVGSTVQKDGARLEHKLTFAIGRTRPNPAAPS